MKRSHALLATIASLAIVASCGSRNPYACTSADQCVENGASGICGAGFCAFSDAACEGGYRYEASAGGGLAGTCTAPTDDAGVPDGPACGEIGEACCASDACNDGTCTNGTCESCVNDVAFGRRFGCVLKAGGTVWCSGGNADGQLGIGLAGATSAIPMQVRDTTTTEVIADATAIGLGRDHACAVRANGEVWCWGANGSGQLGNGANVTAPAAVRVVKTDATPLTGIVEVRGGYNHSCGRDAIGQIWCWGSNSDGELGDGTVTERNRASLVLVAAAGAPLSGALELYTGGIFNCVRRAGDEVLCWGHNDDGQLGDGSNVNRPSPVTTPPATALGAGNWHQCRVNVDATISCAGWNRAAIFGNGLGEGFNGETYTELQKVLSVPGGAPLTGAVAVAAAGGGTCALMQDTSVRCWGDGQYGQNGTGAPRLVPAPAVHADGTPLLGVERLVAKWPHTCARLANGAWECWGRNSNGEFGDGTFANRGFPARLKVSCP